MQFDFSPGALVNAGGAFLFLLAGIAILLVARHTPLGWRLGAFAIAFGLAYVAENLVDHDVDPVSAAVVLAPALATAAFLGLLVAELARDLTPPARRRLAGLALALAAIVAAVVAVLLGRWSGDTGLAAALGSPSTGVFVLAWLVEPLLVLLLATSAVAPSGTALRHVKGRLLLGLAPGLFAVNILMVSAVSAGPAPGWRGAVVDGASLLVGLLAVGVAFAVLLGPPDGARRFARRAFAAIVVIGLAGCAQQAFRAEADTDLGTYGMIRTAGAVLLLLAIVKHDLLRVPLPKVVVRRGAVAGSALAVLFIVAQVAQNFLSDAYGLLTGGIIAGAFLFAASPVQKAFERMVERPRPSSPPAPTVGEESYKAAVRLALRGGIDPAEEVELMRIADANGIGNVRAAALRREVAAATKAGGP